jgi:ubiquinone/menaquinone biosynthesis C-methylase UbiE
MKSVRLQSAPLMRRIFTREWVLLCLAFFLILCTAAAQTSVRDSWQQPEKIMDSLGIRPGMIIGEAGAGDGYFTFHLSKRVGSEGKIYANDIDNRALQKLSDRSKREDIQNIVTVLGKIDDPLFPKESLDCVVMMMAFHDFEKPVEWMKNVIPALKPGAFLAIIDPDPDKTKRDRDHFWTKKKVLSTMEKTDFVLVRLFTFLERDNIYVYRLK